MTLRWVFCVSHSMCNVITVMVQASNVACVMSVMLLLLPVLHVTCLLCCYCYQGPSFQRYMCHVCYVVIASSVACVMFVMLLLLSGFKLPALHVSCLLCCYCFQHYMCHVCYVVIAIRVQASSVTCVMSAATNTPGELGWQLIWRRNIVSGGCQGITDSGKATMGFFLCISWARALPKKKFSTQHARWMVANFQKNPVHFRK